METFAFVLMRELDYRGLETEDRVREHYQLSDPREIVGEHLATYKRKPLR